MNIKGGRLVVLFLFAVASILAVIRTGLQDSVPTVIIYRDTIKESYRIPIWNTSAYLEKYAATSLASTLSRNSKPSVPSSPLNAPIDPNRVSAQWLPTGQRLFCTSYTNDTHMWLKPERPLVHTPDYITIEVEECPAPIQLMVIKHFPSAMSPVVAVNKKLIKTFFAGKKAQKPKPPTLNAAQAQLFVFDIFVRESLVEEMGGGKTTDGPWDHPEQLKQCVRHCLASPCCSGVQISNNDTHRRCDLISQRLDETRSEAPYPSTKRPVVLLAQRREYRPSLATDMWRLTVQEGPERVVVIPDGTPNIKWWTTPITVRLNGVFGVLRQNVDPSLSSVEVTMVQRPDIDALLTVASDVVTDRSARRVISGPHTLPFDETGAVMFSPEEVFSSADETELESLLGTTWCIEVRVSQLQHVTDSTLQAHEVRPTRVCSLVTREPKQFVGHWESTGGGGGRDVGDYNNSSGTRPSTEEENIKWTTSRDPDRCAPMLRNNECCLPRLHVRLEDAQQRLAGPTFGHDLYPGTFENPRVSLAMHEPSKQNKQKQKKQLNDAVAAATATTTIDRCIRLIAGYHSILDDAARGYFTHVVVEVTCPVAAAAAAAPIALAMSNVTFSLLLNGKVILGYVSLPSSVFSTCAATQSTNSNALFAQVAAAQRELGESQQNDGSDAERNAPVAFSLRALRFLAFLQFQLRTMAAFSPNSLVVLHLSAQWALRPREQSVLQQLNASHPAVYINSIRLAVPPSKAAHVHAANIRYLIENNIPFSHVIVWASNELLVRAGIETFVKKYDMSTPGRIDAMDGVAHDNVKVPLEWWPEEDFHTRRHRLWEFMPWDGVANEFALAGTLRRQPWRQEALHVHNEPLRFPMHQVYLEGAFFSREIAKELVAATDSLPFGDFCTTSGQYANNEIIPFLLIKSHCGNVRCGGRVSTMLWREFFYYSSPAVLEETRCSPFYSPFGWKRVKKYADAEMSRLVDAIATNSSRRKVWRDSDEHCRRTFASAMKERDREKNSMISSL